MDDERHGRSGFSRRELLKRAGIVGAVAAVPVGGLAPAEAAAPARNLAPARAAAPVRESLETLTAFESDTLEAIEPLNELGAAGSSRQCLPPP